eukprot:9265177-Alexandrium_andersonii.AAC.1
MEPCQAAGVGSCPSRDACATGRRRTAHRSIWRRTGALRPATCRPARGLPRRRSERSATHQLSATQ